MSVNFWIFGGIAILAILQRLFSNFLAQDRASDSLRKTNESSEYASSFAENLDLTVLLKKNVNTDNIRHKLPLIAPSQLGCFTLKSFQEIEPDNYLCLTIARYDDVEYNKYGNGQATHVKDLNFKISLDEDNKSFRVYSDLHDGLIDKSLREDFANHIWEILSKV